MKLIHRSYSQMKNTKRPFIYLLTIVFAFQIANAQDTAFQKDILKFKQQDSISFPPKNAILFVGSSSFTKWQDVQSYFPGYKIINRGFGGFVFPGVVSYSTQNIIPYYSKQGVVFFWGN